MSEALGLGESDADARWVGLRRHQAVVLVLGVVLAGNAVLRARAWVTPWEWGAAVALLAAAVSWNAQTLGERAGVAAGFALRRHWCPVSALDIGEDLVVCAGAQATVRVHELEHVGRRDLAGRDVRDAEAMARLVDAVSSTPHGQHVSLHVRRGDDLTCTVLALDAAVAAPEGWRPSREAVRCLAGLERASSTLLERFTYLRAPREVLRVFRVRDFSAVASEALLEGALRTTERFDVAVHLDVVDAARSHRMAARAVHRVASDDAATRAFGYRRSARAARSLERLARREVLVAEGRALVRVAVFVVVRAPSLTLLRPASARVWRQVHDAGLRLERGWGRQASWWRAQLPGGPGW